MAARRRISASLLALALVTSAACGDDEGDAEEQTPTGPIPTSGEGGSETDPGDDSDTGVGNAESGGDAGGGSGTEDEGEPGREPGGDGDSVPDEEDP